MAEPASRVRSRIAATPKEYLNPAARQRTLETQGIPMKSLGSKLKRRKTTVIRNAVLCFATVLAVSFSFAQGNTKDVYQKDTGPGFFKKLPEVNPKDVPSRELKGIVRDVNDNPVQGAIVTVTNLKTKAAKSFVTKADGRYLFDQLIKADDYEVKARFRGRDSETKKLSTFDPREKPVLNLHFEEHPDAKEKEPSESASTTKPKN